MLYAFNDTNILTTFEIDTKKQQLIFRYTKFKTEFSFKPDVGECEKYPKGYFKYKKSC